MRIQAIKPNIYRFPTDTNKRSKYEKINYFSHYVNGTTDNGGRTTTGNRKQSIVFYG
jgi:hypothetical protein